jgi:hypothetical protein
MRQGQEAYREGIRQVIDPAGLHSYVVDPATIFRAVSPDGSAGHHRRIFAAEDKEPAARAGVIAVGDSAAFAAGPYCRRSGRGRTTRYLVPCR